MSFSKFDQHSSPLFHQLQIIKFPDLVYFHNAIFMFQFKHNLLPVAFDNYFQPISLRHSYNTRLASKSSYCLNKIRTNYGKFSIRYAGASIWNNLEEKLKFLSIKQFKSQLKSSLIQSYNL